MSLLPLIVGPDGRWAPGIGDPTVGGWLTVASYVVAALLALRAYGSTGVPKLRAYWGVVACALLLLGVNKQLDVQSWLTEVGRDVALARGWWESRRALQAAFLAGVALASAGGALAAWRWLRGSLARVRLSLVGLLLLLGWLVARAASFHHLDRILGGRIPSLRTSSLVELAAIAIVAAGAWRFSAASPPGRRAPRSRR